jgi:hypothetical protein
LLKTQQYLISHTFFSQCPTCNGTFSPDLQLFILMDPQLVFAHALSMTTKLWVLGMGRALQQLFPTGFWCTQMCSGLLLMLQTVSFLIHWFSVYSFTNLLIHLFDLVAGGA